MGRPYATRRVHALPHGPAVCNASSPCVTARAGRMQRVESMRYRMGGSQYRIGSMRYRVGGSQYRIGSMRYRVGGSRYRVGSMRDRVGGSRYRVGSMRYRGGWVATPRRVHALPRWRVATPRRVHAVLHGRVTVIRPPHAVATLPFALSMSCRWPKRNAGVVAGVPTANAAQTWNTQPDLRADRVE